MRGLIKKNKLAIITGGVYFALLIVMGYSFIINAKERRIENALRFPIILNTAEGLRSGSRVTVQGIDRGQVMALYFVHIDEAGRPAPREIGVANGLQQGVMAIVEIENSIKFFANARVTAAFSSLIGRKILKIDTGYKTDNSGEDDFMELSLLEITEFNQSGRLPARPNSILTGKNFDEPIYLLSKFIGENRQSLAYIVQNLYEITEKIDTSDRLLSVLINDPVLYRNSLTFINSSSELLVEVRDLLESLRESRPAADFLATYVPPLLWSLGGL